MNIHYYNQMPSKYTELDNAMQKYCKECKRLVSRTKIDEHRRVCKNCLNMRKHKVRHLVSDICKPYFINSIQ